MIVLLEIKVISNNYTVAMSGMFLYYCEHILWFILAQSHRQGEQFVLLEHKIKN